MKYSMQRPDLHVPYTLHSIRKYDVKKFSFCNLFWKNTAVRRFDCTLFRNLLATFDKSYEEKSGPNLKTPLYNLDWNLKSNNNLLDIYAYLYCLTLK
jgi:hypothetical protein